MKSRRLKPIYKGFSTAAYTERLEAAIQRYGLPFGAEWLRGNSPMNNINGDMPWASLSYMQPEAAVYWHNYLNEAMLDAGIYRRTDLRTITILHAPWHFGSRQWRFDLHAIKRYVRRALRGTNYIVMIEFEIYRNLYYWRQEQQQSYPEGKLICPHVQGIIWGPLPRSVRKAFDGGILGAPAVKLKRIYHLPGASLYMVKPPYKGRSAIFKGDGNIKRAPWPMKDMSLTLHHLCLKNLWQFTYSDLTLSGGEGVPILAAARRTWRKTQL
jgi:hypothetical protein